MKVKVDPSAVAGAVPAAEEAGALDAARSCPEQAITVA
jgi:ferredoxin